MDPPSSRSQPKARKGSGLGSVGKMSSKKSPIKRAPVPEEDPKDGLETVRESSDLSEVGPSSHDEEKSEADLDPIGAGSDSIPEHEDSFIPLWEEVDDDDDVPSTVSSKAPLGAQESPVTTLEETAVDSDEPRSTISSDDVIPDIKATTIVEDKRQENETVGRVPQDIRKSELDDVGRVNYYKSAEENSRATSSTPLPQQSTISSPPLHPLITKPSSILEELRASYLKLLSLPSVKHMIRICLKTATYLGFMYLSSLAVFVIIIPYLADEEY